MKFIIVATFISFNLCAQEIYATFNVAAKQNAHVAFSSSGIVKNIKVDVGSVVKKNDILASLDSSDLHAALMVQKTTLKFAKKDLQRQEKIKNIIDEAQYDSYVQKYESAKSNVAYQKALLDKTILKAPFDGVIISKEIEVGDVVSGQMIKTAFKIQSKSERKLILEFDQKYHNKVKVGDIYSYQLDGSDRKYNAKITKVYPFADSKTRKIKAEVQTKDILVGLFGDGYIKLQKGK
jgi:RND family efflux transporter MFP subunit